MGRTRVGGIWSQKGVLIVKQSFCSCCTLGGGESPLSGSLLVLWTGRLPFLVITSSELVNLEADSVIRKVDRIVEVIWGF
jgi:hypothetical protein